MVIDRRITGRFEWLPYRAIRVYTIVTLLLALLGPVNYEMDWFYATLMVLYILSFLLVTRIFMNKSAYYVPKYNARWGDSYLLLLLLKASIFLCFIIKVLLLISSIKIYGIPSISNIFTTLANVYTEMHHGEFIGNIYRQIDTFCTFIFYFAMFVGVFWFKKIGLLFKLFLVVDIVLDLLYQMLYIGTQRSIITIVILGLAMIAQSAIKANFSIDKKKIAKIVAVGVFFLIIVMNILSARKGLWNPGYYQSSTSYNFDHPLLIPFLSQKAKYDVCTVISYLTQGYKGLVLSFQVPFKWTCFLGSVRGLNSILSQIFSCIPDMVEYTYPVRAGLAYNFDGLACWYTIFPWLASDYTFIGALLIMGFVGRLYMKTWVQTVKYKNPLAFMVFTMLTIEYVFIIANNQLFIQRGESLATVILFAVYKLFNKRFDYCDEQEQSTALE